MNSFTNDIEFLQLLRSGSSGAFEHLYTSYYKPLCYFAENLIGDAVAAQDLATESFIKLLQKPVEFESGQNIKSYLYTLTRNACFDHLRASQRHQRSFDEIRYFGGEAIEDAERQLIRAEILQSIYTAIETLPDKYKSVVRLALLEGRKNEYIAEVLQMAPQTVRNHKSEAFKLLRRTLGETQQWSPLMLFWCLWQLV